MLLVNEEGYEFMLYNISDNQMEEFSKWIDSGLLYGIAGISQFNVPKGNSFSKVYVVNCDSSKSGTREILDYWISRGVKYSQENIDKLWNVI